MSDDIPLSIPACAAAAALLGWMLIGQWLSAAPAVPRHWLTRPPVFWRLLGPLAPWLASVVAPFIPAFLSTRDRRRLKQAGLDGSLTPADLMVARLTVSIFSATSLAALQGAVAAAQLSAASAFQTWMGLFAGTCLGLWLPDAWIRHCSQRHQRAISKALPFTLDVVTLAVEAGANLTGALQYAVAKGPGGPLREEISRLLSDVRAGRSRAQALRSLAERLDMPAVSSWVTAMVSAERQGSSLGPVLRAQAEQRRQERFQRAETLAMRAPVKMLFPMLVFIFPCTFVLLLFPVAVRIFGEGLLR